MAHDARLRGATHGTVAPVFRDRGVNPRTVVCPDCKAAVGEWCVTSAASAGHAHKARRRMAVRALNAMADTQAVEFSVADLRHAQATPVRKRRLLRSASGLSLAQVTALVGGNVSYWERGSTPTGEAGARYGAWLRSVAER